MQVRYFYEIDCVNLNRKARLYYPFHHRLADLVQKVFSVNLNRENLQVNKENIGKIIYKINTVREQTDWEQNLLNASFVIFDSETTGLMPFKGDKVISLAGVIIEEGVIKTENTFDKLINPLRSIPPRSTDITGITNSMVTGMPTLLQVLPEFLDFIENRILVAHFAPFDLAFLNIELGRLAPVRILNPVIDTYLLAQSILPDMIEYSLESLLKRFGIKIKERHTALGDSLMTAQLFLKLLDIMAKKEICTLNQLCRFLVRQRDMAHSLTLPEQR
ncbi:MAG: 3'-5' exonuclease [Dethiobacter sp.]|jgi:DNA polymerase-3 subunit epsilon|nr:MAG: 3'-5' exonuclease [Dethiobacter sp.]